MMVKMDLRSTSWLLNRLSVLLSVHIKASILIFWQTVFSYDKPNESVSKSYSWIQPHHFDFSHCDLWYTPAPTAHDCVNQSLYLYCCFVHFYSPFTLANVGVWWRRGDEPERSHLCSRTVQNLWWNSRWVTPLVGTTRVNGSLISPWLGLLMDCAEVSFPLGESQSLQPGWSHWKAEKSFISWLCRVGRLHVSLARSHCRSYNGWEVLYWSPEGKFQCRSSHDTTVSKTVKNTQTQCNTNGGENSTD